MCSSLHERDSNFSSPGSWLIKEHNNQAIKFCLMILFAGALFSLYSCHEKIKKHIFTKDKKSDFINPDGSFNKELGNLGYFFCEIVTTDEELKKYFPSTHPKAKDFQFREGESSVLIVHDDFDCFIFLFMDEDDNIVRKEICGS